MKNKKHNTNKEGSQKMRHIIELWTENGEKEVFEYPTKKAAYAMAKEMKASNEVFTVYSVKDDGEMVEVAGDHNF